MITIKVWTCRNTKIEWDYDNPQQAAPAWEKIIKTGRAPDDTSEKLSRAYYWGAARKRSDGPDKAWAA